MSKRSYRTVPVNEVTVAMQKASVQADTPAVVSVDVAKFDNMAAVMQRGNVLWTVRWKAPNESGNFVDFVRQLQGLTQVELVMESTGTYGDPLRAQMAELGVPVYRVSSKHSHDASELYDGVPSSHDAKSCQVLGWLHVQGKSRLWTVATEAQRDLAAAAERYELLNDQLMACLSRLEAKLSRHFPELTELVDIENASTLTLLAEYGDPAEMGKAGSDAEQLMKKVGGSFLSAEKPVQVVEAARTTLGLGMTGGERELVRELALEANRLRGLKSRVKGQLEHLTAKDEPLKRVAEVVGVGTAALLAANVGPAQTYSSAGAFVKAMGLNLKERSSGQHKGKLKISKRGSGLGRKYLFLAVLRLLKRQAHFKAWYARKVERDGNKQKLKAVVALMRKLAAGLWHVAKGQTFDPGKLFDAERLGLTVAA